MYGSGFALASAPKLVIRGASKESKSDSSLRESVRAQG